VDYGRPDCYHPGSYFPYAPSPFTGDVYEIKSSDPDQVALGIEEVDDYIIRLTAHNPKIPWHPGLTLLAPPQIRVPGFPYVVFNLQIEEPGVLTYDPEPDYLEAAKVGVTAFALTLILLLLKEPLPDPVPEPIPQPAY
jgi:hypothetical protein